MKDNFKQEEDGTVIRRLNITEELVTVNDIAVTMTSEPKEKFIY